MVAHHLGFIGVKATTKCNNARLCHARPFTINSGLENTSVGAAHLFTCCQYGKSGKFNLLAGRWFHTLLAVLMQVWPVHGTHAPNGTGRLFGSEVTIATVLFRPIERIIGPINDLGSSFALHIFGHTDRNRHVTK